MNTQPGHPPGHGRPSADPSLSEAMHGGKRALADEPEAKG